MYQALKSCTLTATVEQKTQAILITGQILGLGPAPLAQIPTPATVSRWIAEFSPGCLPD